jgi:hypothetical protein
VVVKNVCAVVLLCSPINREERILKLKNETIQNCLVISFPIFRKHGFQDIHDNILAGDVNDSPWDDSHCRMFAVGNRLIVAIVVH